MSNIEHNKNNCECKWEWKKYKNVIIRKTINNKISTKIAGFDLDFTLIKPKHFRKFPINENDWEWFHPNIPIILKQLYNDSWTIVIFSNQAGIQLKKKLQKTIMKKINILSSELGLELIAFIATHKDNYRKPSNKMWDLMVNYFKVDICKSFYVGDAAGRKKDFSNSDKLFAENIGIDFLTPEEFINKFQE